MKNTYFTRKKVESQLKKNKTELSSTKKKNPKPKEIYADVRTTQTESKQAIGYPNLALKSQVSSLKHN